MHDVIDGYLVIATLVTLAIMADAWMAYWSKKQ